ncbi:MAG: hypothetical protein ACLUEK_02325 [Oscillospiraceae bacterium]
MGRVVEIGEGVTGYRWERVAVASTPMWRTWIYRTASINIPADLGGRYLLPLGRHVRRAQGA